MSGASFPEVIGVRPLGGDRFVGTCEEAAPGRGFGGHVMAIGLRAAQHEAPEGRRTLSLRARFVRPVAPLEPVELTVRNEGDSRNFSRRHVTGFQRGKEVLSLHAEFVVPDADGFSFQIPMPSVPGPEKLDTELLGRVEVAHVEGDAVKLGTLRDPSRQRLWNRIPEALPADPELHASGLLYISDASQLWLTMTANGIPYRLRSGTVSSVEHSMWFHRPLPADEWSLYDQVCPSTSDGLGMVQGHLYGADGALGATVSQVGVMRPGGFGPGRG